MDGFVRMVRRLIIDNGVPDLEVLTDGKSGLCLPGFFRPTKNWDLLVVSQKQLIAAVEFKSQVGPSFGNNFNNRVEEALGNATDLRTAYREGVFKPSPKPFIGYVFVLEDCPESRSVVSFRSCHFPAMPEFKETSYAKRYEIFCRKLVREELYDAAALVMTKKEDQETGDFGEMSDETNCLRFATTLAGKIAAISAERELKR